MTLSSVANTAVARSQVGQQKSGTAQGQAEEKKNAIPAESRAAKNIDDTVTLSKAEKVVKSPVAEGTVDEVLPRTKAAILQNSKIAVASQANISSQAAKDILAEG